MAKLKFNLRGHSFQSGLKSVRLGYEAAESSLQTRIDELQKKLDDDVDGLLTVAEVDEDGEYVWCEEEGIRFEIDSLNDALNDIRRTFAVSYYHQWERYAQSVNEHHAQFHGRIVEGLNGKRIQVHDQMDKISTLVNAIKHNNPKHIEKLQNSWPEVVRAGAPSSFTQIFLCEGHMDHIYHVISSSGESG